MADVAALFDQLASLSQSDAKELSDQLRAKLPKSAPKDKKESDSAASDEQASE